MRKIKIKVDNFELRLIIRALAEWRNTLIAENKSTEDLDELLIDISFTAVGIINIPTEKELIAAMEEMRENPLKSA